MEPQNCSSFPLFSSLALAVLIFFLLFAFWTHTCTITTFTSFCSFLSFFLFLMLAGPHTKADAASNKHRSWKSPPASPQASICCVGIISRSDGLLLRDRSRDGGAVGEMQAKNPREATIRQGKCTERSWW